MKYGYATWDVTSLVMNCGFGNSSPLRRQYRSKCVIDCRERFLCESETRGDSRRETVRLMHNVQLRVMVALCRKGAVYKWFVKLYNILTHSDSCINSSVTVFSKVHLSVLRELAALLNLSVPVWRADLGTDETSFSDAVISNWFAFSNPISLKTSNYRVVWPCIFLMK